MASLTNHFTNIINRYAPISLGADLSNFTRNERVALSKLVDAGKLIERIYLRQKWKGNEALHNQLLNSNPRDEKALLVFNLLKGPWDRVDGLVFPNFPNTPPHKPQGGNFYPEDMTKEEFESWVKTLPEEQQRKAKGFYHVVRRREEDDVDGKKGELYLKPYSEEYKDLLSEASELLKESSKLVDDKSLSTFLRTRADSFLSNEYLDSEVDWLKISKESRIEVTVGPYEVYTDELFSIKSAFEFYIHARDFPFSKTLEKFSSSLQEVEDSLPVPDEYKSKDLKATPIIVVDQLFAAGDVAVPMTAAYNLPNDEEAIKRGGSKLVIIKNVQEGSFQNLDLLSSNPNLYYRELSLGKYQKILDPIAHSVIAPDQLQYLSFDAFFTHVLLHEVAHSNGPHYTIGPNPVTVRSRLQEYHSAIEEAKADITGLYAAAHLLKIGLLTAPSIEQFYVTYLASAFRSIRFGIKEAHGLGQCIQLNYIISQGGFAYDPATSRFNVNFSSIASAVSNLTREILMMQGDGDKNRVKEFIDKYGGIKKEVEETLERLEGEGIPIDVRPLYEISQELMKYES
ncbi:10314_t:CDS:2 [Acaulospora morrowiae]|uniref:10314_t:CDS:1 n=1 Tax=Acaulospora morrowiae TaxID=94023 RepID=A0A9N9FGL8_9GLOM|nr:10314_t:CDS:2 [Acaulospora morrowiae]